MTETLLEELARESAERERKKRQASQGQPRTPQSRQSHEPIVALYSLIQSGDRAPLILARHVCEKHGWLPIEYVDPYGILGDHEPSMYRHCMDDVAEGLIKVLVTCHTSVELVDYCEQFGCKVIEARV